MNWLKRPLRAIFDRVESMLDAVFGAQHNPLAQLGALGWYLFWLITASGIYLFVFFDTGVTQAYESIESISRDQWWAGGIMRSIHRYASDALVLVAFVHLLREFALDRMRGVRWFAWITGLLLVGFIYVCGITGYWMVWDQLAQYVALTTSRWLDVIPIFAEPISRNFLSNTELSGRFFTLMVYIHIAAPLLMLLFMWVHIQRYNHARVNPTRPLMIATTVAFVALSLLMPALSQAPANLDQLAASVGLDWFYIPLYPLVDTLGGVTLWGLVIGIFVVFAALPWVPPLRRAQPAVVHLDNCNGCARCFADCPFSAITMQPRSDGSGFTEEAVVDPDLCVSCGICVGACPTATPFRRATALVPGIELPESSIADLRERVEKLCAGGPGGPPRILAFRCAHGAAVESVPGADVAVIDVPCTGMVPPSFLDLIVTRRMAAGVLLAGCRESECHQRLGVRWTEARVAAERDPYLRDRVPRDRVAVSWASPAQKSVRARAIRNFATALAGLDPALPRSATGSHAPWRDAARRLARPLRWAIQLLVAVGIGTLIVRYSDSPAITLRGADEAIVTLSFSHAGRLKEECRKLTPEEIARLEPNMRRPRDCPRARWPVYVELELNGKLVYRGEHLPAGIWDDGPSSLFERFAVPAGAQHLTARLRDSERDSGFDFSNTATVELVPGQSLVVGFRASDGFSFR
ncbi:MAG: hydrogenase iron-sulfur subunit [Gammaproteobacteria bacterium]|nr:hydrogenase iron-sulfur subunit [Gammaproteobacteria bacterium]